MDVVSLYTNIPHDEGISAFNKILQAADYSSDLITVVQHCIKCILQNNVFSFDGKLFLQTNGTAMGTKMVPKYANIFMAQFEQRLFDLSPLQALHYFRLLDDIFMVKTNGENALNAFTQLANSIHPSITFTVTSSTSRIHFLDTTIHIKNNLLETEIF